jgi:hypothetical protein
MTLAYAFFITRINEGVTSDITPYLGDMGLSLFLGYVEECISREKKHQYV